MPTVREIVKRAEPSLVRQARLLASWKLRRARRWPGFGMPLNGQQARLRAIIGLLEEFEPHLVLETGTFLGDTTRFFSGLGHRVVSVEISPVFHAWSRIRLHNSGVDLIRGEASTVLPSVLQAHPGRLFAYLDAHWGDFLPLREEVAQLVRRPEVLIAIDDFRVPTDPEYAFDVYDGQALELELLGPLGDVRIAFPTVPASRETCARRGTVYLARGERAEAALQVLLDQRLLAAA